MEKELNKVTKAIPVAAVSALELRLAQAKYEQSEKKTVEGARVGAEKAADEVTQLEKICQRRIEVWRRI